MAHIHRKYIDSHWLIFAAKGILALLFGWLALFNAGDDVQLLVSFISIFLLGLSVIEFGNSLHRAHMKTGWIVSVLIALIDTAVALALLLTINLGIANHLIILACYTILRGICEIVIAFRTTVDPTDRFIWLVCGICGAVMGVVILNSGHLASTDFIRFFGAYVVVLGICNLIYSVHNRFQKLEDLEARKDAAKTRAKSTKSTKTTSKKPAKKTAKKK